MNFFRRPEIRIYLVGLFMLMVMSIIVARLWYVQVKNGPLYTAQIRTSSEVTVRLPAVRGEIRDRNNIPLVQNRANYEVDLYLPDIVSAYRKEGNAVPEVEFKRKTSSGFLKEEKEANINKVVEESIMPRLAQLDMLEDYNTHRLQMHYRNNRYVPFTYIEKLDEKGLATLAEHNVGLPGVELSQKAVRQYVFGAFAPHILGYVGEMQDIQKAEDIKDFRYYQPDPQGKLSIESGLDKELRGKPGARILRRNAKGQIEGVAAIKDPVAGSTVYLTIDARIQFITEMALRQSGAGRAAAVVVDPNKGDILAMASIPSFDPNIFIPSISSEDWKALEDDETDPLMNRALNGQAPGSTYKIPIALAGLLKGLSPGKRFTCIGGVQYGAKFMKCWIFGKGSHGSIDLSSAIKYSCNAFFYQWGNAAGIEKIVEMGEYLGLGKPSTLPFSGEQPGILPSPQWLQARSSRERWSDGYTANTSIGQGFVSATPLQMAMVAATVANGGISYYPRIVDKVVRADGEVVEEAQNPETGVHYVFRPRMRASLIQKGLTPEQIEVVRYGMWRVVNDAGGTASAAKVKGYDVAGKTGTAQVKRGNNITDNHVWFISFAPYKDPKYAICIMVANGKSGGGVAAPIARRIYEECFAMEKGYTPPMAPLPPAKGSFRYLDHVDFSSTVPAEFAADEETGERIEPPAATPDVGGGSERQTKKARPESERPNVREAPDDDGRVRQKKPGFLQRLFQKKPKPEREEVRPTPRRRPAGRL